MWIVFKLSLRSQMVHHSEKKAIALASLGQLLGVSPPFPGGQGLSSAPPHPLPTCVLPQC